MSVRAHQTAQSFRGSRNTVSFRAATDVTGVRISRMKRKWNEGIRTGGNLPPVNVRFLKSVPKKYAGAQLGAPASACQKSLAEFAARRRQRDFDHFLSGRVPDRKYLSGCKCAICTPGRTNRARGRLQSFCQKRAKPFFDSLKYIQYSFVFQTLNWGKDPV